MMLPSFLNWWIQDPDKIVSALTMSAGAAIWTPKFAMTRRNGWLGGGGKFLVAISDSGHSYTR
jgi:hypothetical protein